MKLSRRQSLHLAAGAAALPAVSRIARAQAYPTRPVRIIVGFAPGGAQDIIARLIGEWLSGQLGQPFLIENRTGANGNIAAEAAARAPANGYTLLMLSATSAINATIYDRLSYNLMRDIAPVAAIVRVPLVMAVNPSFPAKTVSEFVAYAKINPGKINFASSGNGNANHVAAELLKMIARIDMVHVPYRGEAAALPDLLGGQMQVMFPTIAASIGYFRAGQLRALGVSAATRSAMLPDIPPIGDYVPGYEASNWFGLGAPKNTPAEIVERLNKEINAGLANPRLMTRIAGLASDPMPMTAAEFDKFIATETEKWAKVVRAANIRAQ